MGKEEEGTPSMDILYLVDRLENLIASSRRMPLVNQIIVKEADILSIIDQLRTSVPEEIKQARRVIQEKERILGQANADATALLTRAREESERVMNREGLLRAAEERSQELVRRASEHAHNVVRQAEEHTEQLQAEADSYAAETLRNLKEHLLSIETEVGRTIMSIEKGLESLETPLEADVELLDNDADESDMEDNDDGLNDTPLPQGFPRPRRSSLATDTTGGPNYA